MLFFRSIPKIPLYLALLYLTPVTSPGPNSQKLPDLEVSVLGKKQFMWVYMFYWLLTVNREPFVM
jgi:hypothetical protein